MALRNCSECGGQVSSNARVCPHCGKRAERRMGIIPAFMLCSILVVLALVAASTH